MDQDSKRIEAALVSEGVNRRSLVGRIGAGALSGAALGAIATGMAVSTSVPAQAQTITDADILNFALNLEYTLFRSEPENPWAR